MKKVEKVLYKLMNYQKFQNNPKLADSMEQSFASQSIAISDLTVVSAGKKLEDEQEDKEEKDKPKDVIE